MKKVFFLFLLAIIGLSAKAQTAYIANYGSNTISVINLSTNAVVATIPVSADPYDVSVSPDGRKVYISYFSSGCTSVSVINTATDTVMATIAVGEWPWGIAVSPDGSKIYVSSNSANTLNVIDTITNTVSATIPVGPGPYGVTVSPNGRYVYVANNNSTISVISTSTNTVTNTISVETHPDGMSVSPDGSKLFVANNASTSVSVINTATNSVSATITVGNQPQGIAVTPDGSKVYVANSGSNSVSVINAATNTISNTIAVGNSPYGVSISPDGSKVYVANSGTNTVSVINTASNTVSASIIVGTYPKSFGNFISIYTPPTLTINISAASDTICAGYPTTITVSGATSYSWSNGLGTADTVTVMPTTNTIYSVTGTSMGVTGTASIAINVITPAVPNICMVTTDSSSFYRFNVVCWDKTLYNNVDSFIVYRKDVVSSSYLRIGAVSASALSEFTDTSFSIGGPNGGNPRYSSWFYKLAIRDTCGNIGDMSPYHQSMFVQQGGANFSWNAYGVETGQTNPVTGYSFLRDDDNTGSWHVLVNTGGLSTTDPNYATYPNGNWRIDALGFDCAPTMRLSGTSSFLKSHSNTIKPVPMSIEQHSLYNEEIAIYPNPVTDNLQIQTALPIKEIEITDIAGRLLYTTSAAKTINCSSFAKGVYFVKVKTEKGMEVKKIVKE